MLALLLGETIAIFANDVRELRFYILQLLGREIQFVVGNARRDKRFRIVAMGQREQTGWRHGNRGDRRSVAGKAPSGNSLRRDFT